MRKLRLLCESITPKLYNQISHLNMVTNVLMELVEAGHLNDKLHVVTSFEEVNKFLEKEHGENFFDSNEDMMNFMDSCNELLKVKLVL